MSELLVSPVGEEEQEQALATLVLAFAADPVERWLYPEPGQYLEAFPRFLAAFGGGSFAAGTAWRLGEFAAVALWLRPGAGPDGEAIVTVLSDSVAAAQHDEMFDVLGQMDAARPTYPHWYLPWLGADASRLGQGLGGQLIEHGLGLVDASHQPAYLETPNPRTIGFYQRHGFEVTGEARAGSCPPVTFMLRAAR